MPKEKAVVRVRAERYEWICLKCEQPHVIYEVPKEVRCGTCGEEYKVGARITRFIPPVELELSEPFSVRIDRTKEK